MNTSTITAYLNPVFSPASTTWPELCQRPEIDNSLLDSSLEIILKEVETRGDQALLKYTRLLDRVELDQFAVSKAELEAAANNIPTELQSAIEVARQNIDKFHRSQKPEFDKVETSPGVSCWLRQVAIEKVGLYIPGGSAPLFSTLLMLGVPASIAGCKEIVVCSPPDKSGKIPDVILFTANLLGIEKVYKIGGAQAIAAMAYGTESIPKVDKIFGPGNQFVTRAKQLIQEKGIAIDLPAGPSELMVVADASANPEFIAADLLSQAEHGPDSQVVLVCLDDALPEKVNECLDRQLELLDRAEIARKALSNSRCLVFQQAEEAIEFANAYAPEHLILALEEADRLANRIRNAGSVFLGHFTPESLGDYASGTNHTLPTNGFAKAWSGVSMASFYKTLSFQKATFQGLEKLGPVVERLARAEGLEGHRNAVSIRLKQGGNDL